METVPLSSSRQIRLIRDSFPDPPALDTAVSHVILRGVSDGTRPATLRVHRPGPVVAFGPLDRLSSGYEQAVGAARDRGFGAVQRLAGGRAAVFHEQTIAFSWAIPDPQPRLHIERRFREASSIIRGALRALGVEAHVGEVPGEYCPGEYSINAGGRTKIVGVGQRILLHAAHVGGVVVVGESQRVRDVLIPVYEALGLGWDPATAGSIQDEVPGAGWSDVATGLLRGFAASYELLEEPLWPGALAKAREILPRHEVRFDP